MSTTQTTPGTTRPSTAPTGTSRPTATPRPTTPRPPATSRPTAPRPTTSATPACSISPRLLGRDLEVLPTTRKVVALTFDGGASNDGVASILATLSREGVPATFFLTGDFVDGFPSSARAMARYPVGNHTYNHPDLTTLSNSAIRTEIRTAEARIKAVTGRDPRPYFRFPFGAVDSRTTRVVNGACYVPFRWTVDTLGWKGTSGGQSGSTVVTRVLSTAPSGQIVLMHVGAHPTDRSTLDADALPQVINGLRAKGYGFVTLEAALSSAP
jgi:peptidoglycan/xylan/chitin deacetylase (PgdA/CDA1 family)